MRQAGEDRHGARLRAVLAVLWRGGLRVQEALALTARDLDERRGSLLVRSGKGGRRREIGIDIWGWEQLRPWLVSRLELPMGRIRAVTYPQAVNPAARRDPEADPTGYRTVRRPYRSSREAEATRRGQSAVLPSSPPMGAAALRALRPRQCPARAGQTRADAIVVASSQSFIYIAIRSSR
jgi:integrase